MFIGQQGFGCRGLPDLVLAPYASSELGQLADAMSRLSSLTCCRRCLRSGCWSLSLTFGH